MWHGPNQGCAMNVATAAKKQNKKFVIFITDFAMEDLVPGSANAIWFAIFNDLFPELANFSGRNHLTILNRISVLKDVAPITPMGKSREDFVNTI